MPVHVMCHASTRPLSVTKGWIIGEKRRTHKVTEYLYHITSDLHYISSGEKVVALKNGSHPGTYHTQGLGTSYISERFGVIKSRHVL